MQTIRNSAKAKTISVLINAMLRFVNACLILSPGNLKNGKKYSRIKIILNAVKPTIESLLI
jgi:hypothetical protein